MRHIVDYPPGPVTSGSSSSSREDHSNSPQHINKLSALIQLPATEIAALFGVPVLSVQPKRRQFCNNVAFRLTPRRVEIYLDEVSP